MIIDEISMINLRMLNIIENQCKKISNIFSNFESFFEDISMMILMNDFYQFFSLKNISL